MSEHPTSPPAESSRRGFFAVASLAISALMGLVISVPVVGAILDPLRRRSSRAEAGFLPAGRLTDFVVGTPQKITLLGPSIDAWTHLPHTPIGAVWVIRRDAGDTPKSFEVFSGICPHLGCAIQRNEEKKGFHCPCHGSRFAGSGALEEGGDAPNPSPRDMDRLAHQIQEGLLLVDYRRFESGTPDRVEIG